MVHILFNPLSDSGRGLKNAKQIENFLPGESFRYQDITALSDPVAYILALSKEDRVVLAGGDGTLNRFANQVYGRKVTREILYYAAGSGNDFKKDVQDYDPALLIPLNKYINDLPLVTVQEKNYRFINGVGFGLDGYCCEECNRVRQEEKKQANYALVALKGLLFHYIAPSATVTVDGASKSFRHVILAPTMKGRYYGGGIKIAPTQNRNHKNNQVSLLVAHCPSKLKTLWIFASAVFGARHLRYKKAVEVFTGSEITVEFDRPTALQIDGETISDVLTYTIRAR